MKWLPGIWGRWAWLVLAILPTLIVLVVLARAWASDDLAVMDRPFWSVVVLQIGAIAVFSWHAIGNKRLPEGDAAEWIVRFVVLIPFGMLDYWRTYLWPVAR
ncbi:hypothetical protein JI752_007930 [Lysobacter sp. MMG2]|uniref:hypothetical protein n=1 Tax=Lysobacter sp. MMG2 TaxID=2801338 RepID=UPI001C217C7B|nr:hypothetical protein [Lysobacter sp. MMG2]MBU8976073.1 hypothetical protein [Lysobacter sp. MMG2]